MALTPAVAGRKLDFRASAKPRSRSAGARLHRTEIMSISSKSHPLTAPTLLGNLRGLNNFAGGLRYHLNARRFRRTLWRPYTDEVALLLQQWAPQNRRLVIIGPSAGWHLPAAFLQQFEAVIAIEPDPLARWLLKRRFPSVAWQFHCDDYFTPQHPLGWSDNTARLFGDFPDAALLFAHFLGQLVGLHPLAVAAEQGTELCETSVYAAWKQKLNQQLAGRTWASFHDRLSGLAPPCAQQAHSETELPLPDLQVQFWPTSPHFYDHLTGGIGAQLPHQYRIWQRKPDVWHLVAVAWQNRKDTPSKLPAI